MTHWPQLSWLVYTNFPHWVWQAANGPVNFKKLNPKRTREDLVPTGNSEPEEDEDSPQDAEPVTGIQEWMPKTFGVGLTDATYNPFIYFYNILNICILPSYIE